MKKRGMEYTQRGHLGDESEDFLASQFLMARHPNGSLRPDLVSVNGRYTPKISIEAKSGISQKDGRMKGNMVSYQLHYAVTTPRDYEELFGVDAPRDSSLFDDVDFHSAPRSVAYYYNLIARTGGPTSGELRTRWDRLRSSFGNQIIIPAEIAFYSFAAHMVIRTKRKPGEVVQELRGIMREDVLHGNSHAEERKSDPQSRQNIQSKDMFAIYNGQYGRRSPRKVLGDSKERVKIISSSYGKNRLDQLERIEIPGPNGTTIYVLAEPGHKKLFDNQLRNTVRERTPILEEITLKRRQAVDSLKKVRLVSSPGFFGDEREKQYFLDTSDLSDSQVKELEELLSWCAPHENPLSSRLGEYHSDTLGYHADDPQPGENRNGNGHAHTNGSPNGKVGADVPF